MKGRYPSISLVRFCRLLGIIQISMTENGDPLENPIAERINGIIKNEYLKYCSITNQSNAMQMLQ
ncbi:MAG TPA: integrase core domain-containing protein, partial [Chitinophagaceae bacterium]|nr:integrase core domain-containing protein [Chitinophagaceae bacterium]